MRNLFRLFEFKENVACYNQLIESNNLKCPNSRDPLFFKEDAVKNANRLDNLFAHFLLGEFYYHCIFVSGRDYVAFFNRKNRMFYYTETGNEAPVKQSQLQHFERRLHENINWGGSDGHLDTGAKCYGVGCRCLDFGKIV